MKKNIIRRRVLIGVVLVLLVAGVFIWRYLTPYKPEARAETALISAGESLLKRMTTGSRSTPQWC